MGIGSGCRGVAGLRCRTANRMISSRRDGLTTASIRPTHQRLRERPRYRPAAAQPGVIMVARSRVVASSPNNALGRSALGLGTSVTNGWAPCISGGERRTSEFYCPDKGTFAFPPAVFGSGVWQGGNLIPSAEQVRRVCTV